jgi:hypothetical protein
MFWFRPRFAQQKVKINISALSEDSGLLHVTTSSEHGYSVGDYVEIYGNNDYQNKIHKIVSVTNTYEYTIDASYITGTILTPFVTKSRKKERAAVLYGYNILSPTNNGMSIDLYQGYVVITINNTRYSFYNNTESYDTDTWHAVIINLSNKFKQLTTHQYKLNKSQTYTNPQNEDSSLTEIKYESISLQSPVEFNSDDMWSLLGSGIDLTNIRIFKSIIEQEISLSLVVYKTRIKLELEEDFSVKITLCSNLRLAISFNKFLSSSPKLTLSEPKSIFITLSR